ncbi:hypothetical protein MYCTH_2124216 [Thermothelomyces thermophilus ATCC 42464]|uniref:Uncharacterized protein n=1 Tax=Thermothelomyces thermophilus (strain ATCC 42464 / BCRC 31852 / DSM 1799) TaxID=573729 RepID=G2Q3X6_THET4|nr:uncharacterized protein MYCTH_2124216 [Thermothelomyces thermophilus ATCC 42464]AEO55279.1 hypothetical protein MYCTH_2124216 [Thermothelomyces thermophilus ATCC 42464]
MEDGAIDFRRRPMLRDRALSQQAVVTESSTSTHLAAWPYGIFDELLAVNTCSWVNQPRQQAIALVSSLNGTWVEWPAEFAANHDRNSSIPHTPRSCSPPALAATRRFKAEREAIESYQLSSISGRNGLSDIGMIGPHAPPRQPKAGVWRRRDV